MNINWRTSITTFQQFIINNKKSILSFIIVGAFSTIINFGSFTLLWKWMGIHYQIAVSIAYLLSVLFHFFANSNYTFRHHDASFFKQLPRYLTMIFVNYVITLSITRFVVEVLHLTPYLGLILAIGVTVNTGYLMSHYWVFSGITKKT